jgi:hypothetical protein
VWRAGPVNIYLPIDSLGAGIQEGRPGFEVKMRRYAPRSIAFLGKRAFSAMID